MDIEYGTYFFFFNQKTAYEMRISDWSSDVCSSDLLSPDVEDHVAAAPVDHGAREARVAIERRHGLPSSAVGVVLPGRGATHAGAAVLDGAEQPVAIDLRHVEEALVGVGCRRPHGGGRTGILLAVAVAVVQLEIGRAHV